MSKFTVSDDAELLLPKDDVTTKNPTKVHRPFWRYMVPRHTLGPHDARQQSTISREDELEFLAETLAKDITVTENTSKVSPEAEAEFLAGALAKDVTVTENPTKVDGPFWRYMVARLAWKLTKLASCLTSPHRQMVPRTTASSASTDTTARRPGFPTAGLFISAADSMTLGALETIAPTTTSSSCTALALPNSQRE